MLNQVKFNEYPALADLGTGDFSSACLILQSNRVNLEQFGGLLEGEGTHGLISKNKPSPTTCRQHSIQIRQHRQLLLIFQVQHPAIPYQVAE